MWIEQVDCDALRVLVKHTTAKLLVSRISGEIVWANDSFCEWSNYSLPELTRMSWMQLSVHDENLQADIEMAKSLDVYNLSYTVQKKYIPKNGKPQIGNLHVTRYPPTGEIDFCFCRWEPFVDGTSQAFEVAVKSQENLANNMAELTKEIKSINSKTEEESFLLALVRMMKKYPKTTGAVVIGLLGATGADVTINTLQRLGLIAPPAVVVKDSK